MQRGVFIIALGYEMYGELAFNLAMSLKTNSPNIHITVLYSKSSIKSLRKWHLNYFDNMIECPADVYKVGKSNQYQRAKLYTYRFSPYEETIYLDADVVWNPDRKVESFFETIDNVDFTVCNKGYYSPKYKHHEKNGYTYWGSAEQIANYFKLENRLYQCQTTFFYFKRNEKIEEMFKKALEVYDDPKAPCCQWAGGKPDEFCFNVAMSQCNIRPHKFNYMPVYIQFTDGIRGKDYILDYYWVTSNCGNRVHVTVAKLYNNLVHKYCVINKIPDRFYHTNKKELIPERQHG